MKKYALVWLTAFPIFLLTACSHNLSVRTNPPGAAIRLVEVNGDRTIDLGDSPADATVTGAGDYILSAEKSGYSPLRKRIVLGDREKYTLELIPVFEFDINSDPDGASVVLEDKAKGRKYKLGRTPLRHVVEGKGPFILRASKDGYRETEIQIEPEPGKEALPVTIILSQ